MRKFGLSAATLKWIALLSMTIDHIGVWFNLFGYQKIGTPLRCIGRLAAPIFLLLITDSARYTKSRPKLMRRLYSCAILHGGLCLLLTRWTGQANWNGNIFPTLLYTVLTITAIDDLKQKKPLWFFVLLAFGFGGYFVRDIPVISLLVPYIRNVEYSALFVALGVAWYYLENRHYQCLLFLLLCIAIRLIPSSLPIIAKLRFTPMFSSTQQYMIFALPLLMLYNGEKGRRKRWFFYVYYPIHQYILLFFAMLIK